jgi:histone-binding protein RBBP4
MTELRVVKEELDDPQQMKVNEEFRVWRKNIPYLYDMLLSHAMIWPSLTIQWFPDAARDEGSESTTQRVLMSTRTSGNEAEYIQIVGISLPDTVSDSAVRSFEEGGYGFGDSKVKVLQKIPTPYEINRARYMPSQCNIIATRFDTSETYIYDYTKHQSFPKDAVPEMVLKGHRKGGYGVAWNPITPADLITSGEDGLICMYDLRSANDKPSAVFECTSVVNDVSFSCTGKIFAGGCDAKEILVVDPRQEEGKIRHLEGHGGEIFTVKFSLDDENIFATGAKDGSVCVWDMRKTSAPIHTLTGHESDVLQVQWSPHFRSVLASSSADRRVYVWDLSKVGAEQSPEDAEDGPPELLFIHGGHTDAVPDIDWNPHEPWEVASVADDNVLQIWQVSREVAPEGEFAGLGEDLGEEGDRALTQT